MAYLYVFALILLFSFIEINGLDKKGRELFQIFFIILLTIIAGFRYETGVDWVGYQDYFDNTASFDEAFSSGNFQSVFGSLDFGYSLFNSLVKMFGGGLQTIFLIVSVISNLLLLKNLRYYTNFVITGILIYFAFYFFIFDMSGLRQGLAIQIVFYAYRFIVTRNFKKYFFFIILAGSIHWTAFLLIFLYSFAHTNHLYKRSNYIVFGSLFVFVCNIKFLAALIPDLNLYLAGSEILSNKVTTYTVNESFSESRVWDAFTIFNLVRMFALYFIVKHKGIKDKTTLLFFNLLILEIICYFVLYELNMISERLRFYFTLAEIVLIANVIYQFKGGLYRGTLFVFVALIAAFNCAAFVLQFPSTVAYHPYQNYIIYKVFDYRSTGPERLKKHAETH